MTTSADIRALFVEALTGATDAGQAVFSPFDWPTNDGSYPCILVRAPKERKESLGRHAPLFQVTTTIQVVARTRSAALVGDAGSAAALAAIEVMKSQIEIATINNPAIWALPDGSQRIQQFASIDSETSTSSDGEMPMAELLMHFEVEFMQAASDFYPVTGSPLQTVTLEAEQPEGTVAPGFSINLPQ